MRYHLHIHKATSQWLEVSLNILCQKAENFELQLAAWRPGRYQLANYAQKIQRLNVFLEDQSVPVFKTSKDCWSFTATAQGEYRVQYRFHASQMDAGGSWIDPGLIYLNFINFALLVKQRPEEGIQLKLDIPKGFKTTTALPQTQLGHFMADNYLHLIDSPLVASPQLTQLQYSCQEKPFHICLIGKVNFDTEQLLLHFKEFTRIQMEGFSPVEDIAPYYFIALLLPYQHYHGVEHKHSTVITIGPSEDLKEKKLFDELMGVSSHELYHFWNVCRIKPEALLPEDYSREVYFNTGFVLEGVTTYMGDLILLQSGYFELEDYVKILEGQINREWAAQGWKNQSIADASMDLWVDGYQPGIPDKKVSIYNRGALIALCMDLLALRNEKRLQDMMERLWVNFGIQEKGYTLQDIQDCMEELWGTHYIAEEFVRNYILGTRDIFPLLQQLLQDIGISVKTHYPENNLSTTLGIRTDSQGNVRYIHPESPAYTALMANDQIIRHTIAKTTWIQWERREKMMEQSFASSKEKFLPTYTLYVEQNNEAQRVWSKRGKHTS